MLNGVRWLQLKEEFWLLFTNFLDCLNRKAFAIDIKLFAPPSAGFHQERSGPYEKWLQAREGNQLNYPFTKSVISQPIKSGKEIPFGFRWLSMQ
jgi:hypothetical protein